MDNSQVTILIVDDERVNRFLLKSNIEITYKNVLIAGNGVEALEIMKEYDVNLVLLDLMMPKMDGYEVLRKIRNDPMYQTIPVIVITALNSVKDNAKAIELGADAFLTKPFNKIIIDALIKNLLKQNYIQKKLKEAEKNEVFYATVVTANHEINQPLTSIICSANLLEQAYEGDKIKDIKKFEAYIKNIRTSVKTIANMLKKLRNIKGPMVKTYLDSIKMIDTESIDFDKCKDILIKETFNNKSSKNILIVDREKLITELVNDILNDKGFNVTAFSNYTEALEKFKSNPDNYDLAIIDIRKNKEDFNMFYEFNKIKEDMKIILSSAFNLNNKIEKAMKNGAKAFLPKPYDIENLIYIVKKVLEEDS